MTEFKPLKNAMIVIAVSNYDGGFGDLPGTQTSARRLIEWAQNDSSDRNYKILDLTSDTHGRITVDLLREKINRFLDHNFIDRLVVYFAGHGIVRSDSDQFWLLTGAENDDREGIDIRAFQRGLAKTGLGSGNSNLRAGQICLIGDACRNPGKTGIDFRGDAIVTRSGKREKVQIDQFFATTIGEYAYQPNATADNEAYCLFSQVLLDALSGAYREVIEEEHHPFKPAIINDKLADFLEEEVAAKALEFDEEMEPDIVPSIRTPHNYYAILDVEGDPMTPEDIVAGELELEVMGERLPKNQQSEAVKRQKTIELSSTYSDAISQLDELVTLDVLSNCRQNALQVVTNERRRVAQLGEEFDPIPVGEELFGFPNTQKPDAPVLIETQRGWLIAPAYPNTLTLVASELPGDVLLRKLFFSGNMDHFEWDTALSNFSDLERKRPRKISDALQLADDVRIAKEIFPHNAVSAGYLYDFAGDIDNIIRTAHFMAKSGFLPFDLAMLCADKLEWDFSGNSVSVIADLPSVDELPKSEQRRRKNLSNRPEYTRRGFDAKPGVRVQGLVPTYRQGWKFLETETYLNPPDPLLAIAKEIAGRSTAILSPEAAHEFISFFGYSKSVIEMNEAIIPA